jgi:hypothetical protein
VGGEEVGEGCGAWSVGGHHVRGHAGIIGSAYGLEAGSASTRNTGSPVEMLGSGVNA